MDPKFDAKLEAMIVSSNTFGADAIKAALVAAKQKKAEESGKVLLELLERQEATVKAQVEGLRNTRQLEREQKKALARLVKAREAFEKNGEPHAMIALSHNGRYQSYVAVCNNIGITPMSVNDLTNLIASL